MNARGLRLWVVACCVVFTAAIHPNTAVAQVRRAPAPRPPAPPQPLAVRGFADIGAMRFMAADSFDAVLGSSTGVLFGAGGEIVLPQRIFVGVRFSRFQKDGERVFVSNDEVFPLGIDTTIQTTPIEVTGGYRFPGLGRTRRAVPYLGGGVGWHKYQETSEFALTSEDVDESFRGYHLLGGVEYRLGRWVGIGGEAQWTTVPDALASSLSSAAAAFDETDLGGVSFRVRFVVGR